MGNTNYKLPKIPEKPTTATFYTIDEKHLDIGTICDGVTGEMEILKRVIKKRKRDPDFANTLMSQLRATVEHFQMMVTPSNIVHKENNQEPTTTSTLRVEQEHVEEEGSVSTNSLVEATDKNPSITNLSPIGSESKPEDPTGDGTEHEHNAIGMNNKSLTEGKNEKEAYSSDDDKNAGNVDKVKDVDAQHSGESMTSEIDYAGKIPEPTVIADEGSTGTSAIDDDDDIIDIKTNPAIVCEVNNPMIVSTDKAEVCENEDTSNTANKKQKKKDKKKEKKNHKTPSPSVSEPTVSSAKTTQSTKSTETPAHFGETEKRMSDLHLSIGRHNIVINELKQEKQDLLERLSKLARDRLTLDNPNIADLSDRNRPTKLGEMYSELYDNEWTDAYDAFERNGLDGRDIISTLLDTLKHCVRFCKLKADDVLCKTNEALNLMFEEPPHRPFVRQTVALSEDTLQGQQASPPNDEHSAEECIKGWAIQRRWKIQKPDTSALPVLRNRIKKAAKADVDGKLKILRKEVAESIVPIVQRGEWGTYAYLVAYWDTDCVEELLPYIEKCLFIGWLMAVQSPPMCLHTMIEVTGDEGTAMDSDRYRAYTKRGKTLDYVVWPALLLHMDGPLVGRGVAQAK